MKRRKNNNKQLLRLAERFHPWDFSYLIQIEKQMLKQMQQYHEKSNIIVDNPKIARQIKWALRLLDIADGTNSAFHINGTLYIDNNGIIGRNPNYRTWIDTYVNANNYKRFWDIPDPNWDNPHTLDYLRQLKAWYIYNKIRYYYLQTWWD